MKIVILDGYTVNPGDTNWDDLKKIGEVAIHDRTAPEDVIKTIGDADAVFTSKCLITPEVMDACPNLKFVATLATGYDNISIDGAKERNIAVCNVPAYSTEAVTQHTFALILELCNRVGLHNDAVQNGQWTSCPDFCMIKSPMVQLSGKTLGIVGYGTIGKRVGQVAEAFGMKVIPYSQDPENAIKADIITLHCPATAQNKGFVNREFISRMKDGALLINTARGALINEEDLAEAVKSGKLAGAAVDVVSKEPILESNPLLKVPNIIITAHMAWSSIEAREVITKTSAMNLQAFLDGEKLNRIV
ncbi:MAG: D-2-hydroxyacid dehydrogenase [Firmicutes bacterium]|nr:D-2-hydroxyacid dehydrogenase [Bacillota bacterium]